MIVTAQSEVPARFASTSCTNTARASNVPLVEEEQEEKADIYLQTFPRMSRTPKKNSARSASNSSYYMY